MNIAPRFQGLHAIGVKTSEDGQTIKKALDPHGNCGTYAGRGSETVVILNTGENNTAKDLLATAIIQGLRTQVPTLQYVYDSNGAGLKGDKLPDECASLSRPFLGVIFHYLLDSLK